jgi:hypothetical protein
MCDMIRLSVLVGKLLTLLVILMPNVVATTVYTDVGNMVTIAPLLGLTAMANANDRLINIDDHDTVIIRVYWEARDETTSGAGSDHGFELKVVRNTEDPRIDVVDFPLLPTESDNGDLNIQYIDCYEGDIFYVDILCRVRYNGTLIYTYDTDSCTVTTY